MRDVRHLILLFALLVFSAALAAAQTTSSAGQEKSLGEIARELRAKKQAQNPCPPSTACEGTQLLSQLSPAGIETTEELYRGQIHALVARRALVELDQEAEHARTSKERVRGGAWKLYMLYDVVARPAGGDNAAESEWLDRLALLQAWVAQRPDSITARVALADFYHHYGWVARGGGYSDTVSDERRKVFETRGSQALATLVEADKLPAKCPFWHFAMLDVAADLGWSQQQLRAVFDRAVAFEPAFYHYYREYAYYLDPKWYGEPGDADALAEESYRRIGGKEGAFVYFEIATVIYCLCGRPPHQPTLSWPVIQEGFAEVEKNYGASMLKLNRFAMLAFLYGDREVAKRIFARVGDNWDPAAWGDQNSFNAAKAWLAEPNP